MSEKREYKVLAAIPKADGSEWFMNVGRGFENRDASINMFLDAIPVAAGKSMKLQLRALDAEDLRRREAARAAKMGASPPSIARVTAAAPGSQDSIPF